MVTETIWKEVPTSKILVTSARLKKGMVVKFGLALFHSKVYTRVAVLTEDKSYSYYVGMSDGISVRILRGKVTLSIEELMSDLAGYHYEEWHLVHSVLHADLRQIRFDIENTKQGYCQLWFNCLQEKPRALIEDERLSEAFIPLTPS